MFRIGIISGTHNHPNDATSQFRVRATRTTDSALGPAKEVTLRWPSMPGRTYMIEAARGFSPDAWQPVAGNLIGTGHDMEFTLAPQGEASQFYRVRIAP
jgi:hypothetical protein